MMAPSAAMRANRRFVPPRSMPMKDRVIMGPVASSSAVEPGGRGKAGAEPVIGGQEVLRHDADIGDDRHVIGVAVPAGNDVDMDMLVHACTRRPSQVDPDVVPLGRGALLQDIAG